MLVCKIIVSECGLNNILRFLCQADPWNLMRGNI